MNTHTVNPRTVWALVAMESAVALPIISLPTQGDRLPGVAGPLLLVLLLPLGYIAVYRINALRDPSWRLLVGIGLALLTRAVVADVPAPGLAGLAIWLGRSVIPAALGIALWWRGGALSVAEVTAADVRTEFGITAVCMLGVLALMRPFLLPDAELLGASVGLFAVGGLVGTALARQDAAQVASVRLGRTLAVSTALLPAGSAVVLVGILRPELLGTMWWILARTIELALTPLGLLLAWLASLFPRGAAGPPAAPPPRPIPDLRPNLGALTEGQEQLAWLGTLMVLVLMVVVAAAALVAARLLLTNFIGSPTRGDARQSAELMVERTGTPRGDAQDLLGWLWRWLRARFNARSSAVRHGGRPADIDTADSWAAYQRLLGWAERQGLGRRPADTTGQLQTRLVQHAPESGEAVELVTSTYELERYGAVHPPAERLRRVRAALAALLGPPSALG